MTSKRSDWRKYWGLEEPGTQGDRFALLLLVLLAAYVISAFTSGQLTVAIQIVLFLAAAALAIRNGRLSRRGRALTMIVVLGGSVAAVLLALIYPEGAAAGAANLWSAVILLIAVVIIVRRVLVQPDVTLQSIFGAISAYLIIGLMFAAIYSAMNKFGNGHFFVQTANAKIKTFQYFSFTTLTTLGYGDYTAAGSGGQAVAVIEALAGQIFLVTLVARLVSAFRGPRQSVGVQAPPERPARPGRAGRTGVAGRPGGRRVQSTGRGRPGQRSVPPGARRTSSRARARPVGSSPPRPER